MKHQTEERQHSAIPAASRRHPGKAVSTLLIAACVFACPVRAATRYVNVNNASPSPPYTSWSTAAVTIQQAIDAAGNGDTVLVTNGVYCAGGAAGYPPGSALSNRVAIYKPVTVRSVNGPSNTVITGNTTLDFNAARCAYLTNGAALIGFTLTNGASLTNGDFYTDRSGGGVWCSSSSAMVSNCVVVSNSADFIGGGTYGGTLYNCVISTNKAQYGAGVYGGQVANCIIRSNKAKLDGGGAYGGTLYNCQIEMNLAVDYGGGVHNATLYNCTVFSNKSWSYGGGVSYCAVTNCIVYTNIAVVEGDNWFIVSGPTNIAYTCTTPLPPGAGNISDDPLLFNHFWGHYHLETNSPCINRGLTIGWMTGTTDLDGKPRILDGAPDMGSCEFIPHSWDTDSDTMPDWWEFDYSHSMTNITPYGDDDQDHLTNRYEYVERTNPNNPDTDGDRAVDGYELIAGTSPTNRNSVFIILDVSSPADTSATGLVVRWSSVAGRFYRVEQCTNMLDGLTNILITNVQATPPENVYTDKTAVGSCPYFYRIRLE